MTYDFTEREHALILAGLFELGIARLDHNDLRAQLDALAARLGGDPGALFYGASLN